MTYFSVTRARPPICLRKTSGSSTVHRVFMSIRGVHSRRKCNNLLYLCEQSHIRARTVGIHPEMYITRA